MSYINNTLESRGSSEQSCGPVRIPRHPDSTTGIELVIVGPSLVFSRDHPMTDLKTSCSSFCCKRGRSLTCPAQYTVNLCICWRTKVEFESRRDRRTDERGERPRGFRIVGAKGKRPQDRWTARGDSLQGTRRTPSTLAPTSRAPIRVPELSKACPLSCAPGGRLRPGQSQE